MKPPRITLGLLVLSFSLVYASGANGTQAPAASPIQHVVIGWLKVPGNTAQRAEILKASQELRTIPGVLAVRGGVVIPSERKVVDSSYDVGLVIELADAAALAAYAQHPVHQRLVKEVLAPLLARYVVYDFAPAPSP